LKSSVSIVLRKKKLGRDENRRGCNWEGPGQGKRWRSQWRVQACCGARRATAAWLLEPCGFARSSTSHGPAFPWRHGASHQARDNRSNAPTLLLRQGKEKREAIGLLET